jgi:AcrR family transcriptional regulator
VKTGRPVRVPGEKSTKEKIFDAAVDLFAERGYDSVSIRDIAAAVGITEGAVYRHYSGKEEVLDAIFSFVESRIYPPVPEASLDAMADALPFREILESMPRAMMADPELMRVTRVMVTQMYHDEKMRSHVRRELFERPVDETEKLFKKLQEKGKIKPCDARAMATLFISYLVYWYFESFIFSYGKPAEQSIQEKAAHAIIQSFADLLQPEVR